MYRITSGDYSLPVGEPTPEQIKEFGTWLADTWALVDAERTASKARGGTFKDPVHMRTVNAWHALNSAVLGWKNVRPRNNGTNPHREFQISVIGRVMACRAALDRARLGGHPEDGEMITRLTTDYNTAVLVLSQYTGADMQSIKDAGTDQDAIVAAARIN